MKIPEWLFEIDDGIGIKLAVQTSAKNTLIIGLHDNHLKVKISSPPIDGAANKAIVNFFSKLLSIKKRDVTIKHGEFSKRKKIHLKGVTIEDLSRVTDESLWV